MIQARLLRNVQLICVLLPLACRWQQRLKTAAPRGPSQTQTPLSLSQRTDQTRAAKKTVSAAARRAPAARARAPPPRKPKEAESRSSSSMTRRAGSGSSR